MKRTLIRFCKWAGILFLVIGMLAVTAYLWLLIAPPSLRFLYPRVEKTLNRFEPAWHLQFKEIHLSWSERKFLPGIEISNVVVLAGKDEVLLADMPEILLTYRLSDLLGGHFEPGIVEIESPRFYLERLRRQAPAALTQLPATPPDPPPVPDTGEAESILDRMADLVARFSAFEELYIQNAALVRGGSRVQPRMTISAFTVDIQSEADGYVLDLGVRYAADGNKTRLDGQIRLPASEEKAYLRLDFHDVLPSALADVTPALSLLKGSRFPVDARVEASLDDADIFRIDHYTLTAGKGILDYPEIWEQPLQVQKIKAAGSVSAQFSRINLDGFTLDFDGPVFTGSGYISNPGRFNDLSLDIEVDGLKVTEAAVYWPYRLAKEARSWIDRHFSAGKIDDATVQIRFQPEDFGTGKIPRDTVTARVPFQGVVLTYHSPLKNLRKAAGIASFSAHDIVIDVTRGETYNTQLESGQVVIDGLADRKAKIAIEADVTGPANDLRAVVDSLVKRKKPSVRITEGKARTHLTFNFPLKKFTPDQFHFTAVSRIDELQVPDFHGYTASLDTLSVHLNNMAIAIKGADGLVHQENVLREPVTVKSIQARGQILTNPGGFALETGIVALDGPLLQAEGHVKVHETGPDIDMNIAVSPMTLEEVHRFWPVTVATPARNWLETHILSGEIGESHVRINMEPQYLHRENLPENAVEAVVPFTGVRLDYHPPLPPLRDVSGQATFTARDIRIAVEKGKVKKSRLQSGNVGITGLQKKRPEMLIEAALQGPVTDLIGVGQRLTGKTSAEFDEQIESGTARTELQIGFPLVSGLTPDQIDYTADVTARDLRIPDLYGFRLARGELSARLQNGQLEAGGMAWAGETRLDVRWQGDYRTPSGTVNVVEVRSSLSTARFPDFGMSPPSFLRGDADIMAEFRIAPEKTGLVLHAGLDGMALQLTSIGWQKPAGEPASLTARATIGNKQISVSEIELEGKDVTISGSGTIDLDRPRTVFFSFDPVQIDEHRLALQVNHAGERYTISVRGEQMNAVPLLELDTDGSEPSGPSPSPAGPSPGESAAETEDGFTGTVMADLDTILLRNGISLIDVTAESQWQNGQIQNLAMTGSVNAEGRFKLNISTYPRRSHISLHSTDGGTLLSGFLKNTHLKGGTLNLNAFFTGELPTDQPVTGRLLIEDFTIMNAPELVQILSMASFIGLLQQIRSGGIDFSRLEVDYTYDDAVLHLKNGRMEGWSLGMTTEGSIHLDRKRLNLEGMVIPFNLVNKAITAIPVVGKFLVGDGIIATRYTITGPFDDTDVDIHPLSTLPIGFLRKIFRQLKPDDDDPSEPQE